MSRSVVVVGGSNADVIARPHLTPVARTSNPGRVTVTAGGVGRNIAENLARLGTPTYLVSAVGSDAHGELVVSTTAGAGVDIDHVRRVIAPTGTYVALLDAEASCRSGCPTWPRPPSSARPTSSPPPRSSRRPGSSCSTATWSGATLEAAWDAADRRRRTRVLDPVSVPKAAAIAPLLAGRTAYLVSAGTEELVALGGTAGALRARGTELVWERARRRWLGAAQPARCHPAARRDRRCRRRHRRGRRDARGLLPRGAHRRRRREAATYAHAAAALTVGSRHPCDPTCPTRS